MEDYFRTAQRRYMNAAPELRKASRDHWTRAHAENMKNGSPEAVQLSASILAAYDVADEYLQEHEKRMKELEALREKERQDHAQRPLWDGKGPDGIQYEDPETVKYWDMRKDAAGNVYYMTYDSPRRVFVWCTADRLLGHLRRNAAIMAR